MVSTVVKELWRELKLKKEEKGRGRSARGVSSEEDERSRD